MRKELDELKSSIRESGRKEHIPQIIEQDSRQHTLPTVVRKPTEQFDNIETVHAESIEPNAVSLEEAEKDMIRKALERNNGKRKKCAEELKISERTLYRKIKEYNLE